MPAQKPKNTVLFDGECEMCKVVAKQIDHSSRHDDFSLRDLNKSDPPKGVSKDAVSKEIHVIDKKGKVHKNVDAILVVLEEYPKWRWLTKVGRWPIIKQILEIGYKFIASNRKFLFGQKSRIFWVKAIVSLGLIFGLLLSLPLWQGERVIPTVPVFNFLPILPDLINILLLTALISSLVALIFWPRPRIFIWTAIATIIAFCLFDQMRWQPWLYQYTIMLIALGLFSWNPKDSKNQELILNICRMVIIFIYFWAGIFKVNPNFLTEVFPWMISPSLQMFGLAHMQTLFNSFAIIAPVTEIAIAICLLTKKYRNLGIVLCALTVGFVLWTLGPFSLNWNNVIWPWNIAMLILTFTLFYKSDVSFKDILWKPKIAYHNVVLILLGFLPALHLVNAWDTYLSFSVYSGNTNSASITIPESDKSKFPSKIIQHISTKDQQSKLSLSSLAFSEMNVAFYPEKRVYTKVFEDFCTNYSSSIILEYENRLSFFNTRQAYLIDCP